MTGFAAAEYANDTISLSVEIKGCNSRFLELFICLPPAYSTLEPEIRTLASTFCARGRVEIAIKLKENHQPWSVTINEAAVAAYTSAAARIRPGETIPLATLLTLDGVLESGQPALPPQTLWQTLAPVLNSTLEQFDTSRRREGGATQTEIRTHLATLTTNTSAIAARTSEIEAILQKNIHTRFTSLLGDAVDEQRILTETAALLVKWTIAEETARLGGHLEAFAEELETSSAPAKKLEFLCQEINRELNTISAKTPLLDVSRAVVNSKEALENIREQLRNIE
jgi:uncharacterized protein (TIGR00255 family)